MTVYSGGMQQVQELSDCIRLHRQVISVQEKSG